MALDTSRYREYLGVGPCIAFEQLGKRASQDRPIGARQRKVLLIMHSLLPCMGLIEIIEKWYIILWGWFGSNFILYFKILMVHDKKLNPRLKNLYFYMWNYNFKFSKRTKFWTKRTLEIHVKYTIIKNNFMYENLYPIKCIFNFFFTINELLTWGTR